MGTSANSNEPCDKETNDFLVLAQEKNICFLVIGRMPAMMSSEAAKNHGSLENWELRRANARDCLLYTSVKAKCTVTVIDDADTDDEDDDE